MLKYHISDIAFVGTVDEEAINTLSARTIAAAKTAGDEALNWLKDHVKAVLGMLSVLGSVNPPAFIAVSLPILTVLAELLPEYGIPNDTTLQLRVNEFVPSGMRDRVTRGATITFSESEKGGNTYEMLRIALSDSGTTDRSISFTTPVSPVLHIHLPDMKTRTTIPQNISAAVPLNPCSQCYVVGFSRSLSKTNPAPPSLLFFSVRVTETTTPATYASVCRVPENLVVHWSGLPICLSKGTTGPSSVVLETGALTRDTGKLNHAVWKIDPGLRGVRGMASIYQTVEGKIYELYVNDKGTLDVASTYGMGAKHITPLWKIDPDPSGYFVLSWATPALDEKGAQKGWTLKPLRKLYVSDEFVVDSSVDYEKLAVKNERFKRDFLWRISPASM